MGATCVTLMTLSLNSPVPLTEIPHPPGFAETVGAPLPPAGHSTAWRHPTSWEPALDDHQAALSGSAADVADDSPLSDGCAAMDGSAISTSRRARRLRCRSGGVRTSLSVRMLDWRAQLWASCVRVCSLAQGLDSRLLERSPRGLVRERSRGSTPARVRLHRIGSTREGGRCQDRRCGASHRVPRRRPDVRCCR